jgi:BirA family biotin operon repressor/biotin-[acetyl-CoA-carboxylase] ligase
MEKPIDVWKLSTRHIGRQVLIFDSLTSTNDYAIANGATLEDGTVILARSQSAARGRYGRSWRSPAGAGVWMSIVLNPPTALRRPVVLTAWAAVSVAEAIQPLINHVSVIKWPNDVLLRGRKVCGILIEQKLTTIVGIGLNVNQSAEQLFVDGLTDASSMAIIVNQSFDIGQIARALVARLDNEFTMLLNGDFAALESSWKRCNGLLGRKVIVETLDGRRYRGKLLEMTFDGLWVEGDGESIQLAPENVQHIVEIHQNSAKNPA